MQRTTVRLPDDLLVAAKERARQSGRTLTQLLEDALRAELTHQGSPLRVAERSPAYQARDNRAATDQPYAHPLAPQVTHGDHVAAQVVELQQFLNAQPDRDCRSPGEILGYDSHGLPD
jgi:hypothetical protein